MKSLRTRLVAIAAAVALAFVPMVPALAQQGQVFDGAATFLGALKTGGNPPVLTTCGTSPAVGQGANNKAGRLVTGSGATTCTITFGVAHTTAPACVVSAEVPTQPTYTVSATAITFSVSIASTAYNYVCLGVGS